MIYLSKMALVVFFVLAFVCWGAMADTVRRSADGGAAAARAQYMLRQVAAERDALKGQNEDLQKQIEKLNKQIAGLKAHISSGKKNLNNKNVTLDRYKEANDALRDRIEQQRERTQEIIDKFREVVANLQNVERERAQLTVQVKNLDHEVKTCAENNVTLYDTGLKMLDLYKNKSAWDALMQKEPVTGLEGVKIQNMIEDYRHRIKSEQYVDLITGKDDQQLNTANQSKSAKN
jgi:chromosome segregation ATPase